MLDYYTVVFSSDSYRETYSDIEAPSADAACSSAATLFFADHPYAKNAGVCSVILQPATPDVEESSYTAYGSMPSSSPADEACTSYTPYGVSPSTPTGANYTPYYYASDYSNKSAVEAGFTTVLPVAPVPETSYHKTLPNGYAPYRTCRVILPR